jgi:hypothetical protein
MSPLFTDHFENILVILIQDEVHSGLFNLVEREGYNTARGRENMTYLAWGKRAEDDLFDDSRSFSLIFVFFVIVLICRGCSKLIGKLQAGAAVIVLELSTEGEAFHMDLDVGRRHNCLLGSRIHDNAPISLFQHQITRG